MVEIMAKILNHVRNERGAEMVEWIVVVAVLAVVALIYAAIVALQIPPTVENV